MDSPFVKFLAVDIPSAKSDDNVFKSRVEQELVIQILGVFDIVDYSFTSFAFNSFYIVGTIDNIGNSRPTKTAKIRPVDPQGNFTPL